MNDMASAIIPKSDQLNADDLLTGPINITITDVSVKGGQEQPVAIHYDGDDGKPYKPCKSMSRVLVSAWGPDSSKYIGRSLTLYCDPKVKWGGMEVGGIRISHMTDIDSPLTLALTVTRANKKPYVVKPLVVAAPYDWTADLNAAQSVADLGAVWKKIPAADKTKYLDVKDARKDALTVPVSDEIPEGL
jgi:hypothetical protein